jgi:hypothetical protein
MEQRVVFEHQDVVWGLSLEPRKLLYSLSFTLHHGGREGHIHNTTNISFADPLVVAVLT